MYIYYSIYLDSYNQPTFWVEQSGHSHQLQTKHWLQLLEQLLQDQELQLPNYQSSYMLYYADDLQNHVLTHSHPLSAPELQPYFLLTDWHRSIILPYSKSGISFPFKKTSLSTKDIFSNPKKTYKTNVDFY